MKKSASDAKTPIEYFLLVAEWEYPNSVGKTMVGMFNSYSEAHKQSKRLCVRAQKEFKDRTGVEPNPPREIVGLDWEPFGHCLTTKNALGPWFYYAKVVEVPFGL